MGYIYSIVLHKELLTEMFLNEVSYEMFWGEKKNVGLNFKFFCIFAHREA